MQLSVFLTLFLVPLLSNAASLKANTLQEVEQGCRQILTDSSGSFTSPNYPGDYPDNEICTWEIMVEEGRRIRLKFVDFHLEASFKCSNDYLEIYDGQNFTIHCGRDIPPEIESVGNTMSVVLFTDDVIHVGDNFAAEYETIDGPEECEYWVDVGDVQTYGFFQSPRHPAPYPNGVSCRYELRKNSSGSLNLYNTRVAFLRLKTNGTDDQGTAPTGDVVKVFRDGSEEESWAGNYQEVPVSGNAYVSTLPNYSTIARNVLVTFQADAAGTDDGYLFGFASSIPLTFGNDREKNGKNKKPVKPSLDTTSDQPPKDVVTMDFRTKTISSSNPKLADVAHFGSPGARQDELVDYGFFMSPNHPGLYDNHENVQYNITVPEGKRVAIFALRFNLEGVYDHLRLRDAESSSTQSFTGIETMNYVWVTSLSSSAIATFTSDSSNRCTGFLAAVAAVDLTQAERLQALANTMY